MAPNPFEQGEGTGLCAPFSILNALSVVLPRQTTSATGAVEEEMLAALIEAYPGDVRDLIKDGCERAEADGMLHGVLRWTESRKWPAWEWRSLHPVEGEPTAEYLDALRAELESPRVAAVVSFGSDTNRRTKYEPRWSCVTRVTDQFLWLKDGAGHKRIPTQDVGIRPAPRWAIEDCFIISRK